MTKRRTFVLTLVISLCALSGEIFSAGEHDHIVSSTDLSRAIQQKAFQREANVRTIQSFFESDVAKDAFAKTSLDPEQVTAAVPALNDAELARLADQVDRVQRDVRAGALTNQQITYILIALGTAVIVLILVAD